MLDDCVVIVRFLRVQAVQIANAVTAGQRPADFLFDDFPQLATNPRRLFAGY